LQLSGSPANAAPEPASAITPANVRTAESLIVFSLICAVDLRTELSLINSIGGRRNAVKSNNLGPGPNRQTV
jgi:hypothetical protein